MVAFEISNEVRKPHYQGWVELAVCQDTWRDRIKAAFPVKGSQLSAAVVRKDTWDRYILKGTRESLPDVVSMRLCPGETLDVAAEHAAWWRVNDELAAARAEERKEIKSIVEQGIEEFAQYPWADDDPFYMRQVVCEWVCKKLKGRTKNSNLINTYINGILVDVDESYAKNFITQIATRDKW